ncbi:hypothetical protein, partial [Ruthenibacterium lactatiformans]|uniref:hypothetical protein n=1 Tax=Ruthenibacterium lactatiformans TaxID=1550024 RepID=UPI0026DC8841
LNLARLPVPPHPHICEHEPPRDHAFSAVRFRISMLDFIMKPSSCQHAFEKNLPYFCVLLKWHALP